MAGRPRRIASQYAKFSTPEAILRATEYVVAKRGPGGVKLNEIASEVGIEPASIYNHFKGLDGVLSGLIAQALEDQRTLLRLPDGLEPEAAIRKFCLRSTQFFASRSGVARLTINDFAEVHENNPNAFDTNEKAIVALIDREAEILKQHPGFANLDRTRLGELSISRQAMTLMLLGVTWINGKNTDDDRIVEVATLVADMILAYADNLSNDDRSAPRYC